MSPRISALASGCCFLLLLLFARLPANDALNRFDFYKYHPPKGFEKCARESVRDFLSKASKARREELEIVRSHMRKVFQLRMGCLKKELMERKAARKERQRLRRLIAGGSGQQFFQPMLLHNGMIMHY